MRVLLDLNILLDVVQNRAPHYEDPAKVLSLARVGGIQAVLPVHAFTTLYYIVAKAAGKPKAEQTVDWLPAHLAVAVADACPPCAGYDTDSACFYSRSTSPCCRTTSVRENLFPCDAQIPVGQAGRRATTRAWLFGHKRRGYLAITMRRQFGRTYDVEKVRNR